MKDSIDLLLYCREYFGIKSNLLFARPGTSDSFDGTVVLRDLRDKVNLQKPHHFTATGLRHHAATSSQLHARNDTYILKGYLSFWDTICVLMKNTMKCHYLWYKKQLLAIS